MNIPDFSGPGLPAAFGEHSSEAAGALASMADMLSQLAAMFSYLNADVAGIAAVPPRALALIRAGQHLAEVASDLAASQAAEFQ